MTTEVGRVRRLSIRTSEGDDFGPYTVGMVDVDSLHVTSLTAEEARQLAWCLFAASAGPRMEDDAGRMRAGEWVSVESEGNNVHVLGTPCWKYITLIASDGLQYAGVDFERHEVMELARVLLVAYQVVEEGTNG